MEIDGPTHMPPKGISFESRVLYFLFTLFDELIFFSSLPL